VSVRYDMLAEALEARGYRPIHAGDTYDHDFTVVRAGEELPLAGAKLWLTVKETDLQADAQAKLQLTGTDPAPEPPAEPGDIEITDAAHGAFTVHFLPAATQDLAGTWPYDIQAKLSSGEVITLCHGVIEFLENITRSLT